MSESSAPPRITGNLLRRIYFALLASAPDETEGQATLILNLQTNGESSATWLNLTEQHIPYLQHSFTEIIKERTAPPPS